jgi:hypothetical protein
VPLLPNRLGQYHLALGRDDGRQFRLGHGSFTR